MTSDEQTETTYVYKLPKAFSIAKLSQQRLCVGVSMGDKSVATWSRDCASKRKTLDACEF